LTPLQAGEESETAVAVTARLGGNRMSQGISPAPFVKPEDLVQQSNLAFYLLLRWLGCWIDLAVVLLLVLAPALIAPAIRGVVPDPVLGVTIFIGLAVAILYFPVGEAFWGRTLGKLLTGLVIIDRDGRPPGIGKALLRTLLRLIEVNPFLLGGIPAALAVLASENRQRLGDMAARTYVVRSKHLKEARIGAAF